MKQLFGIFVSLLLAGVTKSQSLPTTVIGRGANSFGQLKAPADLTNAISVAAGTWHSLALRADGTVVAWGGRKLVFSGGPLPAQNGTETPAALSNVVAVSAGEDFSLALKRDGTVVAWGKHFYGQTNVPTGLTNATAISAGQWHCLAVAADGTPAGWGFDWYGQAKIPIGVHNAVSVAAGAAHSLILKQDGTVVGWGQPEWKAGVVPRDLLDVRSIAAGCSISFALKRDGTVVGWGFNRSGEATGEPTTDGYPWTATRPVKIKGKILSDVTAISAGKEYALALKRDGTVVGWGKPPDLEGLTNLVAMAAGENHCLFVVRGGPR